MLYTGIAVAATVRAKTPFRAKLEDSLGGKNFDVSNGQSTSVSGPMADYQLGLSP